MAQTPAGGNRLARIPGPMTARERFYATMHYQPRDRCPIMDFGFWRETVDIWERFGLPKGVNTDAFFGMDPQWIGSAVNVGLFPGFEEELIEDRGDSEIVKQGDGVVVHRRKWLGTIPHYLDWTLKDRASWRFFKEHLDPDTPGRIPADWDERAAAWRDRDYPLSVTGGSLYGWIRNWMGVQNVSVLLYDDPALFEEMVETVTHLILTVVGRVLATGVQFDYVSMWEDMCFNTGPLISPQMFRRFLVPRYRRITELFRRHGVDVIVLDCDGKIDALVPHWLDAGVNCMFPIEVGTWGADPVAYRRQYGKDLLMMGGVDKHVLAGSREEIGAHLERLVPLVEEGGYIPFCDHRVPPDVPLENYIYYVELAKELFGYNVHTQPTGELTEAAFQERSGGYDWSSVT